MAVRDVEGTPFPFACLQADSACLFFSLSLSLVKNFSTQ